MLNCKFFNFPKLPTDLVSNMKPGKLVRPFPGRICSIHGEQFETSSGELYYASDELDQWVRKNIPVDVDIVYIRYQYGNTSQSSHGAHCDVSRGHALLYTIDNADGYLQFWQDPAQSIESTQGYVAHDYSNLKKLEEVQTPSGEWYLVNGQIIHSVEALTRTRITLQVNIKSLDGLEI